MGLLGDSLTCSAEPMVCTARKAVSETAMECREVVSKRGHRKRESGGRE